MQLLLNVGGPDRLSRAQMAEAVAQFRGYNSSLIKPVSAASVCLSIRLMDFTFHSAKIIVLLYFSYLVHG